MEDGLRREGSAERLDICRLLLDSVVDYAIYMLDSEGLIRSWNVGAERIKGHTAQEIIGRHFSTFFTPEDREAGRPGRILATARAHGRHEEENWRLCKDGRHIWCLAVLNAICDSDGDILGFVEITRDITERRQAQQALEDSERRFRHFVQSVTDYAIYTLDTAGRVTNWNAGAERIKGYTAAEIIGEHFSRFYIEEDRAADLPSRALARAAQDGRYEHEGWRVRKDGSRFWANAVIEPISDDAGSLLGYAKVTRDMTERRAAQQALDEAREQLFQAQKLDAVGQLTGGIAHDFNNLLTVIKGSLELCDGYIEQQPRLRRLHDAMRHAAERAESLTRQLLAFSRRQPLRPRLVDTVQQLGTVWELIAHSLRADIELVTELAPDVHAIEVDPAAFELAVLNVCLNARDAMEQGGTLRLSARNVVRHDPGLELDGDYVAIAITDSGRGIPPELLNRVVEPFFTTKDVGSGTGLGLSQAYGFARQSRGALTITSEPGRGTTVTFFLPARPRQPLAATRSRGEGSAAEPLPGRRILVVEDDRDVAELAVMMLEQYGYEVLVVAHPAQALDLLRDQQAFDLVFSDVMMPGGMSGIELATRLRQLSPELPVLLTTGFSEAATLPEAHAFPLIGKPYSSQDLAGQIARLLKQRGSAAN